MDMVGMTPAEAALRQRQRMLQMGVFVCCLLLLLDTRAPPHHGDSGEPTNYGDAQQKQYEYERKVQRLDTLLARDGIEPTNVTGYYHGDWSRLVGNASMKGMAVLQLEMLPVPKMRSVSVVRGLAVLAGGLDKDKEKAVSSDVSVSAFGIYLHYYGRVSLVANVGNPYTDIELQWELKEKPPTLQQEEDVPKQQNRSHHYDDDNNNEHEEHLATKRRVRRRGDGVRSTFGGGGTTGRGRFLLRRSFGLPLDEYDYDYDHYLAPRPPQKKRRRRLTTGSPPPPGEEPRTTSISLDVGDDSPFASLTIVVRSSLPSRTSKTGAKKPPATNATTLVVARKPTLEGSAAKNEIDDDVLPMTGSILLATAKPLPYATRPFLGDVFRGGKCSMLIDVEVLPPAVPKKKKKKKSSGLMATEDFELAEKVQGGISGCGIDGTTVAATANRVDWELAKRAALGYSLLMTTMCVIQIGLLFRQLHFSRTQAVAARVSLLCVAAQSLIDAVLCVANLLLCAVVQNLFAAFAAVAFFELIIFCVVEMRYVVVVFQAHDPQRFWMQASTRRQLAVLHAQFYFALFASLCAVYAARDDVRPVVVLAYAFWIPQIIRNARHEFAEPFHDAYLYGMAITRLIPPLYVYAYPYSLVAVVVHNAKLRPGFCLLLVAFQGAQVAFLKAQQLLGPRFFVPPCFLPARYDYRRPLPPAPGLPPRPPPEDVQLTRDGGGGGTPPVDDRVVPLVAAGDNHTDGVTGDDPTRERGFECSICFQFVVPSNRDHFITPCDHVRPSVL